MTPSCQLIPSCVTLTATVHDNAALTLCFVVVLLLCLLTELGAPFDRKLRSQIALTLALPAPSQALDHLDSAGKQEISVLRSIFEGTVDPLDLYLFQEAKFSQAPATQANNLSNPAVASIAAVPSALPKLVPVDSIVQTAGIVTSFARRDLDQLAKFEPEGAEYVTQHAVHGFE